MKTTKFTLGVILGGMFLSTLLFTQNANALVENKKKQLKACVVESGGTIIQIGNICDAGGGGCSPNPCGE